MALYLGKDKIAGFSTDSRIGDTLPVGAIIDYDGTEVPANWELVENSENGSNELIVIDYSNETEEEMYDKMFSAIELDNETENIKLKKNIILKLYSNIYMYPVKVVLDNNTEDEFSFSIHFSASAADLEMIYTQVLYASDYGDYKEVSRADLNNARPEACNNLTSTSTVDYLSANQGRILNDTIGVIRAETLPEPSANWVNTVFRYNGELYVCEEDRKLYTKTNVTTGLNLNGARLHVENIFAGDSTSLLEASDGKGNSFRVYGGDPQDSKMGHYGLYADCYIDGAYLYQELHLGDYTDKGNKRSEAYLDMPELDLVITTMSSMDGVFGAYNVKTNNYIMRKVSKDKKKYFGNYRLSISKSESSGTVANGTEFAGTFHDDLGIVGGCDLNYAEGLAYTDSNTLTCQKEGVYRFDTLIYSGSGSYQSEGVIPQISVWVSINGSSYPGSYNYFRYEVRDGIMIYHSLAPVVVPLAVGDTVQVKCILLSDPTWTDTDTSYHAVTMYGQMAISQVD